MDEELMRLAIKEAKKAYDEGEVPVGAVVCLDGEVVSLGRNKREGEKNALCHAEIEAIDKACKALGGWRLHKCELFVTMEPCPMCAGAIVNSRIKRVVFGAKDEKAGCFGSVINFNDLGFNHKPEVTEGVLEDECKELLSSFFKELRLKKDKKKNIEKIYNLKTTL